MQFTSSTWIISVTRVTPADGLSNSLASLRAIHVKKQSNWRIPQAQIDH